MTQATHAVAFPDTGNIDLWDASDIAARALTVGQKANAADLLGNERSDGFEP